MMRKLMIAAGLVLSLAACMGDNGGVASSGTIAAGAAAGALDATVATKPADVANRTTLDERLATGATVSYTAASRLGTALATAGLIDRARFKALDQQGYAAVLAVKAAYDAGNATSYAAALDRVNTTVAAINTLVR